MVLHENNFEIWVQRHKKSDFYCLGSWSCLNEECSFLKTEKTKNTTHFKHKSRQRVCYSCGQFATRSDCGARKLIQFSYGLNHVLVYNFGHHKCDLNQEVSSDREYIRKWVEKCPSLSYQNLRTTVIQHFSQEKDGAGAQTAAEWIMYKAYRYCKYKHRIHLDSAEVLSQLRQGWNWNKGVMNWTSIMFMKSATKMKWTINQILLWRTNQLSCSLLLRWTKMVKNLSCKIRVFISTVVTVSAKTSSVLDCSSDIILCSESSNWQKWRQRRRTPRQ